MSNQKRTLTPAAIKYLLAISELCSGGRGARSVDVALGLEKDVCRSAAYAALEQLPDALPELEKA